MNSTDSRSSDRPPRLWALVCAVAMVALGAIQAEGADMAEKYSELWGKEGERWRPDGRLPDFSHAGYRQGEAPLPDAPVVANVRDFGARGDGEHDDTAAIRLAIADVERGAIYLPPGRYRITDIIEITKGGVVLRGAGPGQTVLFCPRPLQEIRPNMSATTAGKPTSNYSWSGGIVWFRGDFGGRELARVTEAAGRGESVLAVSSAESLRVGQEVDVVQQDEPDNSLANHLYAGQPGDIANLSGRGRTSLVCRITAIEGDRITLDRPLRSDIEPRWQPRVLSFEPTVTEAGIEELSFEFPVVPYEGHFTEQGYNPLAFNGVAHCWARNITISHCDSGVFAGGRFCTLEGIAFNSDRPTDSTKPGHVGHHGVMLSGNDNLFRRFRFNARFIHDITVTNFATGNVSAEGSGVDLCFDHHKRGPYANLFCDLDLGAGSRMWKCGGGAGLGRHSAAWTTFWNIRAARPQAWPPEQFGPDVMNLVGVQTDQPATLDPAGRWFEPIPPETLVPANLYEAQRQRRLGRR